LMPRGLMMMPPRCTLLVKLSSLRLLRSCCWVALR
jgi:hypothetical protein